MTRSVKEWIAATDDQRVPPRVRDRIFQRDKRCHICTREIVAGEKWDLDHVTAIINGGENRESNLRPSHRKCHVEKTAEDVKAKAKAAAIRKKHTGITRPKQSIKSAGFPQTEKTPKHLAKALPPRRSLYQATEV